MTYMPRTRLFGEIRSREELQSCARSHASPLGDSVRATRMGDAADERKPSQYIVYAANLPKLPGRADATAMQRLRGARATNEGAPDTIFGCDEALFLAASLPGGSVFLTNANGARSRLALRWFQLSDSAWQLYHGVRARAAYAEAAWLACGAPYRFNDAGYPLEGRKRSPILGLVIDGNSFGDITIHHPAAGLTQFEDRWACVRVNSLVAY